MWVATFKAWHESRFLRLTERLDVRMTAYYLNTFRERGQTVINRLTFVEGPDAEKAIQSILEEPRIKVVERTGNQLIYQLPELRGFHNVVADRRFIFVKPMYVENGFEYWTVASLRKKDLLSLYRNLKKLKFKATVDLLSIHPQTPRFMHYGLLTDLTDKQRKVLDAAFALGYYSYPRRTDARGLAKALGIPYTTCMEHLRKAESKVMEALSGKP
ncbi:helix-turn-helix domain-containing protein [Candidatus Micrarchaeota archaeon]|nr:helix-turn-helix domain-containing protein [Candidatus Micrarchaeota archaeon]